jgi:hypothetical protein
MTKTTNLKRTQVEGIFKDIETGALINQNNDRLESYRRQKNILRDMSKTKTDVENLCLEVKELRVLVEKLRQKTDALSEDKN